VKAGATFALVEATSDGGVGERPRFPSQLAEKIASISTLTASSV
jgi:hypothetical protein